MIFYYSGHGSSIKNTSSDEADQRDETIVPRTRHGLRSMARNSPA